MTWQKPQPLNSKREVFIPFRELIPRGSNEFNIQVPQEWAKSYDFYFSDIQLVPDYYSHEAAQFDLDPDVELDTTTVYQFRVEAQYKDPKAVNPLPFEYPKGKTTPSQFIKSFNDHFETNKHPQQKFTPCFIDWDNFDRNPTEATIADAETYYNMGYDASIHSNALPKSVRDLKGVNNSVFPTTTNPLALEMVRVRLNVAPQSMLVFSNDSHINNLGFSVRDIGGRKGHRQFFIYNMDDEWKQVTALIKPPTEFEATHPIKVWSHPIQNKIIGPLVSVVISLKDYLDHAALVKKLNQAFKKAADVINVEFAIMYNQTKQKFEFMYPSDSNMLINIFMEGTMATRLGYPFVKYITQDMIPEMVLAKPDISDISSKAKSLCMDTGMINVFLDDVPTNTVKGDNGFLMADLYPDPMGVMKMSMYCFSPPMARVSTHLAGPQNTITARFHLSRVYETGTLAPFVWKTNAYIFGSLRGQPNEKAI